MPRSPDVSQRPFTNRRQTLTDGVARLLAVQGVKSGVPYPDDVLPPGTKFHSNLLTTSVNRCLLRHSTKLSTVEVSEKEGRLISDHFEKAKILND